MRRNFAFLTIAASLAALMIAGCASGPLGGPVNVPEASRNEFRATVDRVDTRGRLIEVSDRDNGGRLRQVYYDDRSVVQYEGERFEPTALERGDEVTIVTLRDGNRDVADTITVTYDATRDREGSTNERTTNRLRGEVDRIDTRDRRLDVRVTSVDGRSSSRTESVSWDDSSSVDRDGRRYDIRDLREGDQVEIEARHDAEGYYAERIEILTRTGDSGGSLPDENDEIRGTVSRVDTSARRIDLESVSQSLTGTGDLRGSTVYYDGGTVVEYSGRTYEPSNLERGDRIEVRGHVEGSRFMADRITVTYNSRGS